MKNSISGPRSSASLSQGLSLFLFGHVAIQSYQCARAKSRAVNGCRSSMPSPTPMKCTGRPKFVGDRDQDAAARGAVELGHHQPGDARGLAEHLDLRQRVLPDRGIEHQQHRVRRVGSTLRITRTIFSSSPISSVLFCSRPAVSIEHNVDALVARLRERVEGEPGRIGARLARDDRRLARPPQILS